ncbi:MAG: HoxN/HupN/NixA family nickel/cobalt transporter [Acidocella sp.]|uniref:HoxN/HupN/NixA family nickel/cobalt transporter n=1 Tax=Acidocella sp. TaxID=50710 RepID=UPI003FC71310
MLSILAVFKSIFDDSSLLVKSKIIGMYAFLFAANIGGWIYAFIAFHNSPVFLGTALLAWGYGLRHAVDADHIAAIDNVTRKLMQQNKRPVTVGFFFSLGHSLVLVIGVAAIYYVKSNVDGDSFNNFNNESGIVGTAVSTAFLFMIGIMNLLIALSVYRTFRSVTKGGEYVEEDFDMLLNNRGFLARIFRPLFDLVKKGWHMFPIGFLFGLGFDTVTEVTLLAIAATEATKGMPLWSIMVFPLLFTAGMSLIDTTDGIAMLGAYGWAFVKPVRKLFYNLTITSVSVVVALVIGGIEGLGLFAQEFNISGGWFWNAINVLNNNFGYMGYTIIGIFLFSWLASIAVYKLNRYEDLELKLASNSQANAGD